MEITTLETTLRTLNLLANDTSTVLLYVLARVVTIVPLLVRAIDTVLIQRRARFAKIF